MEALSCTLSCVVGILCNAVVAILVLAAVNVIAHEGTKGLAKRVIQLLRLLPGADLMLGWYLRREVHSFLRQVNVIKDDESLSGKVMDIPKKGWSNEDLTMELKKRKGSEFNPDSGRGFSAVYTVEDSRFHFIQKVYDTFEFETDKETSDKINERKNIVKIFFDVFMHENALNPMLFPQLLRFETEVVAMTASMLNGDSKVVGNVTSGGTESILVAVQAYRDRARKLFPSIKHPEVVAPLTVHPAFDKAAHYFGLKVIRVAINKDYTVNMSEFKKAITPNTILLVGSAPEYTHGIIDPIAELSSLALKLGLPLHVDACFGGFMLPWVEKLGYKVPVFDFRLKGVTSMSADVHKYGLGPKGASVVLYRDRDYRRHQIYAYTDWVGGLYGSPIMGGTRPGGNLASSWAVLMSMGQDGYLEVAKRLMQVTDKMKEGVEGIPGLTVCGKPLMTAFAFTSTQSNINVFALADMMEKKGWKMERGSHCIHCSVLPSHTLEGADQFILELKDAVQLVKADPSLAGKGSAGVYGMAGSIPDRGVIKEFVVEFFNEVYQLH